MTYVSFPFLFHVISGAKIPTLIERDGGFYSGSSEMGEDYQSERLQNSPSSPTDTSEDSIEIKITPIFISKNKRKSLDSSKSAGSENDVPLKKRYKYEPTILGEEIDLTLENTNIAVRNPFRPWIQHESFDSMPSSEADSSLMENNSQQSTPMLLPHRPINDENINIEHQEQPLALVTNNKKIEKPLSKTKPKPKVSRFNEDDGEIERTTATATESVKGTKPAVQFSTKSNPSRPSQQRNYKNMTRERRIEANARERSRVHTISAAFDTLRNTIPSYSNTQKLSKLSVLRVACSYILTLSRMVGEDYSLDQSEPSISDCVAEVTKTIQTEGKVRKKKDE